MTKGERGGRPEQPEGQRPQDDTTPRGQDTSGQDRPADSTKQAVDRLLGEPTETPKHADPKERLAERGEPAVSRLTDQVWTKLRTSGSDPGEQRVRDVVDDLGELLENSPSRMRVAADRIRTDTPTLTGIPHDDPGLVLTDPASDQLRDHYRRRGEMLQVAAGLRGRAEQLESGSVEDPRQAIDRRDAPDDPRDPD